jgi:xanthine dehydrogenase molybdopterin-binding subunit B
LCLPDIVMDVGNPINPAIDIGQVRGASICCVMYAAAQAQYLVRKALLQSACCFQLT